MMAKVTIDWEEQENIEWEEYEPKKKDMDETRRRLLITTDNFLPRWDGISRFLAEIVPRLQENYDITIIAPDYGEARIEGVEVIKVPVGEHLYGDYNPPSFAYRLVKEQVRKADLVFNQALGPIGISAILAARGAKRPIASYIHSVEWELVPKALATPLVRGPFVGLTKGFVRWLYNRCSLLLVPSENIAEQYSWAGIRTPKRIAHLGVDTGKFRAGNRKAARKRLELPEDAFIVGFHGRIAREKNLLTLARGFRRLGVDRKLLLIVGDGVPDLRNRIARFSNVIVTGSRDDVVPHLQAMDVYVQPSFTETTSLAVLEAMACQLPIVSSPVGFIKYYIVDGENGLLFDHSSAYDLAGKLKELYDDPGKRERIAANARKTIEKSFQWENTAERIAEALREI